MTKIRTYLELLEIMLDNVWRIGYLKRPSGLCGLSSRLEAEGIISEEEENKIDDYLFEHAPKGVNRFTYWFQKGAKEPRIRYLVKEIKKLRDAKERGKKKRLRRSS